MSGTVVLTTTSLSNRRGASIVHRGYADKNSRLELECDASLNVGLTSTTQELQAQPKTSRTVKRLNTIPACYAEVPCGTLRPHFPSFSD